MQTNENHPNRKRIRNFFREKGYYIVLALCVCAVGVSGWLFVSGAIAEKKALRQETMSIATSAEEPAKNPSAEQKPLAGCKNLIRLICKHDPQRIRAFHTMKHLRDGFQRISLVIIV